MIYLFNNKEELIHIIKEQDLIEFTHKIEINTFDAAEFELPIEAIDKEIIEEMRFFGFFVRGRQFGVFKAYEVTMSDNYVVKGLDRAESDLRTVRIIKDKRLQNVTADQALNVALEGTGYQLGEREGLTKVNKTNFYYISPREALVKIIEAFNCEFRVRYEFVENKIINRYIDLYHRQGSYSGVQFEYGNNALEVTMEEDSDNVVTALIGRGKGEESTDSEGNATGGYGRRIEFTDIVWTKASGKPIDKPAGQNYIVLNDDIENKGLYQNGELKHRWGVFVDEEIEDKEVLLQATYQELLRLNNPIRKYKASILDLRDDIWLGDRVAIVKDSAKLSFEARIFSITIDKLNFDQSEVELGDYETLKSQSQSSSLNAIKEAVRELSEEQEAYNRKVQELIDNKNAEIAEKMRVMRLDMDNGIEDAKNKAEKVKQEINGIVAQKILESKQLTDSEIAKANAKAEEALDKAGTIPDTATLSDQIKTLILNSPDLSRKVTETFNNADNGDTIYSKIVSKVSRNFATKGDFDALDRVQNDIGRDLIGLSRKVTAQTIEYNKLTESNKIYERIIGKTENEASEKLSRLVMSSQIFQTEVGKYSTSGGPNMLKNSRADDGLKYWNGDPSKFRFLAHQFYLNGQKRMFQLSNGAVVNSPRFIFKKNTDYMLNMLAFDANTARFTVELRKRKKNSVNQDYDEIQTIFDKTGNPAFNSERAFKRSFKFNTGDFDNGYLLFSYEGNPNGWSGLFMTELDFYEGSSDRLWQPSPDDSLVPLEAVKTQVTQLAGSYSIKNINSAGDIISGVNLGADGTNRFVGKLTHITGETQIDNAVIKSAMVDKLKTGNFESGSVTTQILASNAVTADKLLVDSAMIDKLVSNRAFIRELTSQKAFITQLASIDFSAERIKGGRLESNTGSMVFDLDNSSLNMMADTASIRRIFNGYPTQFMRYETSIENGQRHSKTIIGSNRSGTENWNSTTFSGIVIDNNSNSGEDGIKYFGDTSKFRHSASEEGWNLQAVTQGISPATWLKSSEIWARHFVVPKKTKSDTDNPDGFVRLEESVAALWKLWAHALGQINMTSAMKSKVQGMLDAFSFDRDHIK